MPAYHFETHEFGLSDDGFHFLRSGFNHETFLHSDIKHISIEKGPIINNRIAVITIGFALVAFALWYCIRLITVISDVEVRVIFIQEMIIPVFPFLIGVYCLYSATKVTTMMTLRTEHGTRRLPLTDFEKEGNIDDFKKAVKSLTAAYANSLP